MNRIPKTETLLTDRCRLRYPSETDIPHIWSATRHPGFNAAHATWNDASRRVLERIGMRFIRVNPRGYKKRGEWVEEHEYEITAEERAQHIAQPEV